MNLKFDKPPQEVLAQFKQLRKAMIDASSINIHTITRRCRKSPGIVRKYGTMEAVSEVLSNNQNKEAP
jgi:hypothetical protein